MSEGKIVIQERNPDEPDFLRAIYEGPTFEKTKVNQLEVFKFYAAILGEVELYTDFPDDVKVGTYTDLKAGRVIVLHEGEGVLFSPNVILQQRGWGVMSVNYFSSQITKNGRTYTLCPNQSLIRIPEDEMRRIFPSLKEYSKRNWPFGQAFRVIDHLLEMVDTPQTRREVEKYFVHTMRFIRRYIAENANAPLINKILPGILSEEPIPPIDRRERDFLHHFNEQVGVKIRTFGGTQRLYRAVVEAAHHSLAYGVDSLGYTYANFNHAFSSSFGISPSAAYNFNHIISVRA